MNRICWSMNILSSQSTCKVAQFAKEVRKDFLPPSWIQASSSDFKELSSLRRSFECLNPWWMFLTEFHPVIIRSRRSFKFFTGLAFTSYFSFPCKNIQGLQVCEVIRPCVWSISINPSLYVNLKKFWATKLKCHDVPSWINHTDLFTDHWLQFDCCTEIWFKSSHKNWDSFSTKKFRYTSPVNRTGENTILIT